MHEDNLEQLEQQLDVLLDRFAVAVDAVLEQFTMRASTLVGGRPVRWLHKRGPSDHLKARDLHIYNADPEDRSELWEALWPLHDELFDTYGIPFGVRLHSPEESAQRDADFIKEPRWAAAASSSAR